MKFHEGKARNDGNRMLSWQRVVDGEEEGARPQHVNINIMSVK